MKLSSTAGYLMRNPGLSMCFQAGLQVNNLLNDAIDDFTYLDENDWRLGWTHRDRVEMSSGVIFMDYRNTDIKESVLDRATGTQDDGPEVVSHEMFHRMGYGWGDPGTPTHDDVYAMAAMCR